MPSFLRDLNVLRGEKTLNRIDWNFLVYRVPKFPNTKYQIPGPDRLETYRAIPANCILETNNALLLKPEKTTECIAPSLATASIETTLIGSIGR